MWWESPLALGSYWGLLTLVPGVALLAVRILDEEMALAQQLAGYRDYMQRCALPVRAVRVVTSWSF